MQQRFVDVSRSNINSIAYSSLFNIGDAIHYQPKSMGIAVQREGNVWNSANDLKFDDFQLFQRPANWLQEEPPVASTTTFHHNDTISVKNISIIGVSQSSIIQIGGLRNINAEARLKHIRILQDNNNVE